MYVKERGCVVRERVCVRVCEGERMRSEGGDDVVREVYAGKLQLLFIPHTE